MILPAAVRAMAACAPGKRVTVIAAGKTYDLPLQPEPTPVEPPHPFEAVSKQMLERDAEIRALLTSVAERSDDALSKVKEAAAVVAAGQAEVVKSIEENTAALYQPVKPEYSQDGKLKHAQRVKPGA